MPRRGTYRFDTHRSGVLKDTRSNARLLRRLLLDWRIIHSVGGPGAKDDGKGSWHVLCHLTAAAAVLRLPNGRIGWLGIVFDRLRRAYVPALCWLGARGALSICQANDGQGVQLLKRAELIAFLEGASRGHILDREACDRAESQKSERRQDYDQNANSTSDGGPVWEMWAVSRDIATRGSLGFGLVNSYVTLLSILGGRFAATVARGRSDSEYGHVQHLCAMIQSGLVTPEEALWDVKTKPIEPALEITLLEATPRAFAQAAITLAEQCRRPYYFMYSRRRMSFVTTSLLQTIRSVLRQEG